MDIGPPAADLQADDLHRSRHPRRTMTTRKRILFVEDEPDTLALMTLGLRSAGFVVEAVGTVAEAQALLDGARYDVVIADWRLPDGEGLAVADGAAGLGSKTIIYSSYLFQIPAGTA